MMLKLKGWENYNIKSVPSSFHRATVIVQETDNQGNPTGRTVVVPYDPIRRDVVELQRRIEKEIGDGIVEPEPSLDYSFIEWRTEQVIATFKFLAKSVLNAAVGEVAARLKERLEHIAKGEPAVPEQVITEAAITAALEKILKACEPVISAALRELAAEKKQPLWKRIFRRK